MSKYIIADFKLLQVVENLVISFSLYMNLNYDYNSLYQFILDFDTIIELSITIDSIKNSLT